MKDATIQDDPIIIVKIPEKRAGRGKIQCRKPRSDDPSPTGSRRLPPQGVQDIDGNGRLDAILGQPGSRLIILRLSFGHGSQAVIIPSE